jgi:hypothetical protein
MTLGKVASAPSPMVTYEFGEALAVGKTCERLAVREGGREIVFERFGEDWHVNVEPHDQDMPDDVRLTVLRSALTLATDCLRTLDNRLNNRTRG